MTTFAITLLLGFGFVLGCGTDATTHSLSASPTPAAKEKQAMQIIIETSLGSMTAELYPDKAPITVANMLSYIDDKFYDDTIFHRVIDGFMIQGGGFTKTMSQKPTKSPIKNEADNGLSNTRGTLAMARTMVVDSATCQFFINLEDRNTFLNFRNKTPQEWGYCVFGKVIEGMEVMDKIAKVPTGFAGPHQNVPTEPVVILSIRRKDAAQ